MTTIHLKPKGLSFGATAHGQAHAMIAILRRRNISVGLHIGRQPCHKAAFRKATYYQPSLEAEEFKTFPTRGKVGSRDLAVKLDRLSLLGLEPELVQ